jgi:hypothetical protein
VSPLFSPRKQGAYAPRSLFLVLLLLLLFATPAPAQRARLTPFGQGTHAFRVVLHRAHLTPITSEEQFREELDDHPERILVISFGRSDWQAQSALTFRTVEQDGAAFLFASDQRSVWRFPDQPTIDGRFVTLDPDSPKAYRGSTDCPFVEPLPRKNCPVFTGLTRVATNRPSFLESFHRNFLLARLPEECEVQGVQFANPRPFAEGGLWGKGRYLVLADHSVFINDMMLPPDNDNFDLAQNAVSWLSEDGKRDRVYFMDDGVLVTDFNVPVKEVPPPPLPSEADLVKMFNKTVDGLEREDFVHRRFSRAVPPTFTLQFLTVALTVLLICCGVGYGVIQLLRSRHPVDPQVPIMATALAGVVPAQAVIDQRQRSTLAEDNFWEAAHGLARQFFDSAHVGPAEPRLDGEGARSRRGTVRRLWQFARSTPRRVSAREFERVVRDVDDLKAALANGTLRFLP